jgi:hypothetical protein
VYTLAGAAKTISGSSGVSIPSATITGTYTNNGTFTVATSLAGTGSLTQGANSSLYVGGTFTTTTVNLTAVPNLVVYNGTGAQAIRGTNYNNLTISGTRTTNNVTLPNGGTIGISGTFTPSATFTTGNYVTTGNTVDFNGSGSQSVPALGSANYNNLTHSGSGTATLSANIGVAGNLTVSGGTLDLSTFTANRATAGGTLSLASGATLKVGGSSGGVTGSNFPNNFTTNTLNGTVEFTGTGAQTIPVFNYTHLTFSNGGTKTVSSSITATGNVTINSGAPVVVNGGVTLQVNGNFTNSGSLTNNGTITVGL